MKFIGEPNSGSLSIEAIPAMVMGLQQSAIGTVQRDYLDALKLSEERYRTILATMPACVKVLDADGALLEMNAAGLAMLEADSLETVQSRGLMSFVQPDYHLAFAQLHRGGGPGVLEFEVIGMQGTRRWLETHAAPMPDGQGRSLMLGITHDVTQRKLAELQLRDAMQVRLVSETAVRESQQRWQLAIEGYGDGLWNWSIPSSTVFFSPRWKSMLGFAEDEIGNGLVEWRQRVHPDDLERVMADVQAHLAGMTHYYANEHRVSCKDGSYKWILDRGLVVDRDAAGKPLRMLGTHADIDVRKRVEERLRVNDAALRAVSQGAIICGPDLLIMSVNQAFERITGYRSDEVVGRNCRLLQGPLTDPQTVMALRLSLHGNMAFDCEILHYRKDGSSFWNELTISPVHCERGVLTHFIGIVRDVTGRHQAQDASSAALREKVVLLNEVHHRVKNNLQVVTSLLRLEARRSVHPETKNVLAEMQGRIRSMALLHESLYRTGIFASVDLSVYLKQLCQQAFRASSQTGAVRLVLDMASVKVSLDQATPCGLLVNELFSNCLKHGFPEGRTGEVRLALQQVDGPNWRLSVSDNGVGLPSDFDTRRETSLGLKLASDLALQLDSTLEVGPGPGASFAVTFCIPKK